MEEGGRRGLEKEIWQQKVRPQRSNVAAFEGRRMEP